MLESRTSMLAMLVFCGASAAACAGDAADVSGAPIRVVIWDERQPEQRQAYETFLGNAIADALGRRDDIAVRSVRASGFAA